MIEIDAPGDIVWQFGQTGLPGGGALRLNGPHNADRLDDGNTIIADSNNNRIVEVDADEDMGWIYATGLNWPRDADRLPNGNTLINDSNNHRIIEVTGGGVTSWNYSLAELSYDSDRLPGGNTLISMWDRIIEVTPAGTLQWSFPVICETEVIEGYLVTAPNGNRLWTEIIQPRADLYPGKSFPAIISVPGGFGEGEGGDLHVARNGFVEFHFNAEGRGLIHPSDGVENYNGFVHQDDLKAVIEYAHTRPNVIDKNVGLVTSSYGITMGAGCLGRYANLEISYLVDQEGPSDSFVTCYEPWSLDDDPSNDGHEFAFQRFGHWSIYRDGSQENIDFWTQREAARYIGNIRCRYLRVQAEWDHAQPPQEDWPEFDYLPEWYACKHAINLVNLAKQGQAPWTRVNGSAIGNPPSITYDHDNPPTFYAGAMRDHRGALEQIIQEMAAMPPLPPLPGDFDEDRDVDLGDFAKFAHCFTGSGGGLLDPYCDAFDFDCDDDVDLVDFRVLGQAFACR